MTGVQVFDQAESLQEAAASLIVAAAARAIAERGRFLLVLAGGTTPRGVYGRLAERDAPRIDWERVHVFWGDERCVPPGHELSNFRMATDSLLTRVPIPASQVHRMPGEQSAEKGAAGYDEELRAFFDAATPEAARYTFDMVLLGIGADGHTASLFPGSPALDAAGWAAAAEAPATSPVPERITLTFSAINSARDALFLATGADKRDPVARAWATRGDHSPLPAGRVRTRSTVRWLLDAAAAPSIAAAR
jgi:6-phosphogluconolactonase